MSAPVRNRGVSLIEVLVALVIISVGLLGIAKMQALAMASTRGSSTRSLVSIEAASLASAMHANRKYWNAVSTTTTTFNVNLANGAIGNPPPTDVQLQGNVVNCAAGPCTPPQMALYDLVAWSAALNAVTAGSTASVTCTGQPVACTILIQWTENILAAANANAQQVTTTAATAPNNSYSLLVEPGA